MGSWITTAHAGNMIGLGLGNVRSAFYIQVTSTIDNQDLGISGTWAYTAP